MKQKKPFFFPKDKGLAWRRLRRKKRYKNFLSAGKEYSNFFIKDKWRKRDPSPWKEKQGSLEQKKILSDDARRESCAREEQTQRDREQCTRLIRAASSVKREGERKEKREKGKKKLSLESIAFIIRESRDNEKATRVFTRVRWKIHLIHGVLFNKNKTRY